MKKILVIGGASMDMTYFASENGYPEKPNICTPGGKGSNQAVAAARAGATVSIATRLGEDSVGNAIRQNLIDNGVNTTFVEMEQGLTNDSANIYIDPVTKDNSIIRKTGAINSFTPAFADRCAQPILEHDVIVAQMKAPKEFSSKIINFCYENNKKLVITPCRPERLAVSEPENQELVDRIWMITANQKECQTMFGTTDIASCVKRFPKKLIVTLGANGVMYHNGKEICHIPALKVKEIIDTTGAGDTFNGNLVAAMLAGADLHTAIIRAQYAAAYKIQYETAQAGMPYKWELDSFMRQ